MRGHQCRAHLRGGVLECLREVALRLGGVKDLRLGGVRDLRLGGVRDLRLGGGVLLCLRARGGVTERLHAMGHMALEASLGPMSTGEMS